ncbi:transcriptional regulator, AraC family [Aliarcobacter faecis]|uniref:AraC family transcriptional regulator n=1 Tax=Aliarcobacter faecis TaxID=1564138 RepID=UPI000555B7FE|nr:AraC family transcriptional regulator [Aliarcobacter faecis]QKF73633.1 transcriptional regulator, AraC family [Aliarcobacter faecis]
MSMEKQRLQILEFVYKKYGQKNGEIKTQIPSLTFYLEKKKTQNSNIQYEPSFCSILQGKKAVGFGNNLYTYEQNEYLLSSTHLPAKVQIIEASEEKPYLSYKIDFKLEDIYEVLKNTNPTNFKQNKKVEKGLFFDELNERLFDAIYRLIMLLDKPKEEIDYLSSLIIKELLFILINDKAGNFLSKFSMQSTISNKIVQVISKIKENFTDKLNIKELADEVGISESSLYNNFKIVTQMTPIQFQKNLRLQEAKMLLSLQNIDVLTTSIMVGYESVSQFSKDYSKMYKMSPKKHANYLKTQNL